jgi:hypothetical protein
MHEQPPAEADTSRWSAATLFGWLAVAGFLFTAVGWAGVFGKLSNNLVWFVFPVQQAVLGCILAAVVIEGPKVGRAIFFFAAAAPLIEAMLMFKRINPNAPWISILGSGVLAVVAGALRLERTSAATTIKICVVVCAATLPFMPWSSITPFDLKVRVMIVCFIGFGCVAVALTLANIRWLDGGTIAVGFLPLLAAAILLPWWLWFVVLLTALIGAMAIWKGTARLGE